MIFPFVALLALSTTVQAVPVPGNNEIRPEKMAEQVNPASPSQVFPLVSSSSTPANAPHKSDHNRHIRSSKDRESDLFEPEVNDIESSQFNKEKEPEQGKFSSSGFHNEVNRPDTLGNLNYKNWHAINPKSCNLDDVPDYVHADDRR